MLPLRLELKNFLAYRTPDPISFEDLHLACLSGANGAGKSSLLDAISWALWGKARTRSDDDLIHLGQNEMMVMLDFQQDEQHYRIIRKRKMGTPRKGGGRTAGQTVLNFHIWDESRQRFALISDPSIRETQNRINSLLRLDYDLFVNSAFLKQGQADAFTVQTPGQRKTILANILGLDRWAKYEEKAREKLKDIRHEIGVLSTRLADMEREITEEPMLQEQLESAKEQQHEAGREVIDAEEKLDEVRGADIELESAQKSLATVASNIRERERDIEMVKDNITRYEEQLAFFQEILKDETQIRAGYAELEKARSADRELGDKLRQLTDLNEQIREQERKLEAARQEIELEIRQLETVIETDGTITAEREAIEESLAGVTIEIDTLEKLEAERDSHQEKIAELKEESAGLQSQNQALYEEMHAIKGRLDLLKESSEALCPVCGQPLDEEQKQQLIEQMEADGTQRGDTYRANETRMKDIKGEIKTLGDAIKDAKKALAIMPTLRGQQGAYEQQLADIEAAQQRIQANQVKLNEHKNVLEDERFAEAARAQFQTLQKRRDDLGYDSGIHDEVQERLETYTTYQEKSQQLDLAMQSVPQIEENLDKFSKRRDRYEKNLADLKTQADEHRADIQELEVKVAEMNRRQQEVNRQRTLLRHADEKVISIEQSLSAIENMKKRQITMQARRDELNEESYIYEQLRIAFGKNGIPAMIIETAIPELEDLSNRLLSRMTGNRMHVRFDTQREKKTGGITETLDILIADELGTRDYELFSGGEAFRINFAIRVALSQLLARRAGARLRTLFIDEGFGTQDEAGRERLVEAITSIQDDFDLILVITHIDELKEAFPARIEVMKTPNGSLARVG